MDTVRRLQAGWGYPTGLLCVYGFFSTVKPLEPFLIPYLTGPDKNLTTEQVANEIFPVWTYSYLVILLPVFLLTDYLRYKPVIVFQCANLFVTTAMLLWAEGVAAMQAMQFFYGMTTASEVLVSLSLMSYTNILVMTLVLTSIAMVMSFFLPMPQRSMFFHHRHGKEEEPATSPADMQPKGPEEKETGDHNSLGGGEESAQVGRGRVQVPSRGGARGSIQVIRQLWRECLQCYSWPVLCWSVWWALATCGYNQTVNYVQVLWEHVEPSQNFTVYNGGVEALSGLFGAVSAYAIGFAQVNWAAWGEMALGSCSALGAATLFLMTFAGSIWVCYASYIIFRSLYMLLITIAMFQIAAELSMERYALIFGANTFGALVLQTILTAVVVDSRGLGLDVIPQFITYGSYFSFIAAVFFLRGLYTLVRGHTQTCANKTPAGGEIVCPNADACPGHKL
ncbi:hypothetical protein AGOR_G00127580 [Albula goreensis]|uniref:Uncharacterized protein n=1 Tax=Albula goreensis TaxID=1534307 RepID=A0A8T3DE79_9TELE|nr:hypothetical protein AGOR_G00127580 [Albula goreensis]